MPAIRYADFIFLSAPSYKPFCDTSIHFNGNIHNKEAGWLLRSMKIPSFESGGLDSLFVSALDHDGVPCGSSSLLPFSTVSLSFSFRIPIRSC